MVEVTVLEKPPELHAVHGERVVGTLLIAQAAVTCIDLTQACHVTEYHIHHL